MEAIVLAGGFGTRLQKIVNDVPKPMAPVAGYPFLKYLLDYLKEQGVCHVVLAVGYKREIIKKYFGVEYKTMKISYAEEQIPLQTGGAVKKAIKYCTEDNIYVLNGDTYYPVDLHALLAFHRNHAADVTIAAKEMHNFSRYGTIICDNNSKIIGFSEKKMCQFGLINGGVYVFKKNLFKNFSHECFMLEKDFMEKFVGKRDFFAFVCNNYFIDIGIPEDYKKANIDLLKM